MTRLSKKSFLLTVLLILSAALFGEQITDSDFGFSLDIPEGFEVSSHTEDGFSYVFLHPNLPVTLIMKITSESPEKNTKDILKTNLNKLSANGDADSFVWNNKECAVSCFSMKIDTQYKGWAVTAPTKINNYYVLLLCYAPDNGKNYNQFIISTINSLCIDKAFMNSPGIITSYAFPKEGSKSINLNIDGKQIKTSIDKSDEQAAKFAIDLEYSVLTLYANHKLWKEAWKRYYRMIYRDNAGRMQQAAYDIYNAFYPHLKKTKPQDADIKYAQTILNWVQTFNYKRASSKTESDFTSIPSCINGTGSDCDSRSMLVSILLNYAGFDSAILISKEFSHALAATDIPAPGQTFTMQNGREYIIGETTAKVTWGMIAKDHADRSKWIEVNFND